MTRIISIKETGVRQRIVYGKQARLQILTRSRSRHSASPGSIENTRVDYFLRDERRAMRGDLGLGHVDASIVALANSCLA